MPKLKLTLAYDGARYDGWQSQPSGNGVQDHIEAALARLFPSRPVLISSSRTDAGVHAWGMVAHLELPSRELRMPMRHLPLSINACLPPDIRVRAVTRTKPDFHARFDAIGKRYLYQIWNDPVMHPLLRHHAWHVPQALDLGAMRTAAKDFTGRHDFRSFTANRGVFLEDAVRTLTRCDIRRRDRQLTVLIEGSGFLYKMCRAIAGTLVQIGQGKFPPDAVPEMLVAKDRQAAGMNAPAHGLILQSVFYPTGANRK